MCADRLKRLLGLFLVLFVVGDTYAQNTYTDGPIQLQVKVRQINTYFDATDAAVFGVGLAPDELRYYIWAQDNNNISGLNWQGGTCLQWNGNPSGAGTPSPDFNYTMFNYTYPTNTVPKFFNLKLDAWEDDSPDRISVAGLTLSQCGGSDCNFESNYCCASIPFVGCVYSEGDDYHCDAPAFKSNMNYRLGSPCEWYTHQGNVSGFVDMAPNACANDVYKPKIQSFWRYTKGTGCGTAIPLGPFAAGSSILHYNSNECYTNNYTQSPGNDVFYSFTVAGPIGINANLCGPAGANFNSVLYLLDANCNQMNMNDDGCGAQSSISTYLCQPGTYYLVVDGATAADQGTFTLTLQEDTNFTFKTHIQKTNITCNGANNGTAKAVTTGGVTPYASVRWSNGAVVDSIGGLIPGTYSVTITDARGCTVADTAIITEPSPLIVDSIRQKPVTCSGYRDGTATVYPSGGTAPYHYFWAGAPPQITKTATNLPAGLIAVTVLDSQGCYTLDSVVVTASTTIVSNSIVTNVNCARAQNGAIAVTINGGTPAYTYAWSNGASTLNVSSLDTGTYHLSVTDQNSCSITNTYYITEPPELVVSINDTANVRCNGGTDGAITIATIGGTQPYTYLWSNGRTTQDLLNVAAGTYTVTVTDAHNCTDVISDTLTEPAPIVLVFDTASPSCSGFSTGSIDLTVMGGTTPYNYLWTTNETTQDISNLPAGAYGVLVTDSNNCFKFEFRSLYNPTPVVIQPPVVSHVSCYGGNTGSINLIVNGGRPAYTYTWSPNTATGANPTGLAAGFYNVTVSDQSGCKDSANILVNQASQLVATLVSVDNVTCSGLSNGSVNITVNGGVQPYTFVWTGGATTEDLNNVPGGSYGVTVTDASSCTTSLTPASVTVTEPTALTTSHTATSPACFGVPNGRITEAPAGGTAPYTYAWNTGATTPSIIALAGGQYSVLVKDANGCTAFDTITIMAASQLSITGDVTHLICNGQANGQIIVHVTGGQRPYSFNWSNGVQDSVNAGLSGGYNQLTVSDAQGCRAVDSFTVNEPAPLILVLGSTDVQCFGDASGVAFLKQMTGGTPPYSYTWSNGQTTAYATGLDPLTYTLTVTDVNDCKVNGTVTVNGPALLVATIDSFHNNSCFGDNNGDVYVSATGGTGTYAFSVLNNVSQASGTFTGLSAGHYTAIVVDTNNCRATNNFTITEPSDWSVTFKDPYIFVTRGSFTALSPVLKDTMPGKYSFSWSPTIGLDCPTCKNPKVSPIETTTYTVTATDTNGCVHTAEIVVVAKDEYEVFYPNAFSPNGDGNNDVWAPIDFGSTESINIKIYDRWGELVFETNDITKGWDGTFSGKPLPSDVYVYQISGTLRNKKDFKKTGSISVLK